MRNIIIIIELCDGINKIIENVIKEYYVTLRIYEYKRIKIIQIIFLLFVVCVPIRVQVQRGLFFSQFV